MSYGMWRKLMCFIKRIYPLVICWGIAVFLFWLIFFKLTPLITRVIPSGEWQRLAEILVYILIGYLGGIGLPLVFIAFGIYLVVDW